MRRDALNLSRVWWPRHARTATRTTGTCEAGASRAFTSDQDWHRLGDVLQSRGERTSGGGDDEDEALAAAIAASLQAPATRPPGAEPPPGPKYAAQLAQLKEMGFTDETACTLALDAAGGDVATAMGALVG